MLKFITARDHNVMRRLNRWHAPRWIRVWMILATRAGDGWLWAVLGALILQFGDGDRFRAVASAALAVGSGIAIFLTLKRAAHRRRPSCFEPHCWATLLPPVLGIWTKMARWAFGHPA